MYKYKNKLTVKKGMKRYVARRSRIIRNNIDVVADVVTMGGALTDKDQPYTATALEKVMESVESATK